jgi:thiamine biosynthesis lipoprotein
MILVFRQRTLPLMILGDNALKNVRTGISALLLLTCSFACQDKDRMFELAGQAQGTTYHITYFSRDDISYQFEIDSLLKRLDLSLSTYKKESIISRFNINDSTAVADRYFTDVFNKSVEVAEKTNGLFDITVAPVINAWGFGFAARQKIDSVMMDSLLQFVGFKMVRLSGNKVIKEKPQIMLDFNAIAQGYSVDVLAAYLEGNGIENYLVELGGEVRARGKKNNNEYWRVGIDKPLEDLTERSLQAVITLKNRSLATSGNYRRYIEENGHRYSHIINPKTGYSSRMNLLSATVVASDCMTADAYATAFMVMGLEQSKQFLTEHKELDLDVFFIYDDGGVFKTYTSEGLRETMEDVS